MTGWDLTWCLCSWLCKYIGNFGNVPSLIFPSDNSYLQGEYVDAYGTIPHYGMQVNLGSVLWDLSMIKLDSNTRIGWDGLHPWRRSLGQNS